MNPKVTSNDHAWVWYDHLTNVWMLDCPCCPKMEIPANTDDSVATIEAEHAFLVATANRHNKEQHHDKAR